MRLLTNARDPQRTRQRILAAALQEFAARGVAGARVAAIARRARVNVRMLYHYFGGKQRLFRAILEQKIAANLDMIAGFPPDVAEVLPALFERHRGDGAAIRMLQWEALAFSGRPAIAEEERRRSWREGVARLRDAQRRRLLPRDLDPEHLALAMVALAVFPLAFPQLVRFATGRAASDPEFRRRQATFLRRLGQRLKPTSPVKEARP